MSRPRDVPISEVIAEAGWLRRLVGDLVPDGQRADDVLQETWLAALVRPPDRRGSLRAWLVRVARSRVRDALRREVRARHREAHAAPGEAVPGAAVAAARAEAHRRATDALLSLPEPYRATLLLHYVEGLPAAEIARRDGIPDATVRSRVRRGLALLRARLGGREDGGRRAIPGVLAMIGGNVKLLAAAAVLLVAAIAGSPLLRGRDPEWPSPPPDRPADPAIVARRLTETNAAADARGEGGARTPRAHPSDEDLAVVAPSSRSRSPWAVALRSDRGPASWRGGSSGPWGSRSSGSTAKAALSASTPG